MRHSLVGLLAVVMWTIAPAARAQEQRDTTAERFQKLLQQHRGDFDYLIGDWRFEARNSDYGKFSGVWSAVKLATGNGSHVLDEYRIVGDGGETYFVSSTLRVYNPMIDKWELVSAHETSGLKDLGTAARVGSEMHIEQTFGTTRGPAEQWRIRYHDIRPDAFRWAADRSKDGGRTWEREYRTLEARRTGPARTLDPLTRPPKRR